MTNLASEKFMAGDIGVRIRFMGDLRAVIESSDLRLALPRGTSVGTLLKSLAQKYGDPFAKWLFTGSGELHHSATPTVLLAESPASTMREDGFTMFRSTSMGWVSPCPLHRQL